MEAAYFQPVPPDMPTRGTRNTFLTVLCILTFIGSGWGTVSATRSYFMADYAASMGNSAIKSAQDQLDANGTPEPDFVSKIMGSVEKDLNPDFIRKMAIFKFISCLITLLGGILMFNLKKIGFYLYVAGIIVYIVAPLTMGGLVGAIGAGLIGFVGVVFIVMYAVNLKQMTR